MKRQLTWFLTFVFVASFQINAQVTISIFPINSINASNTSLFNAGLTNSTGGPIEMYLVGTVKNLATGAVVISAKTGAQEFKAGYTQLIESRLNPTYSYNGTPFQSGHLPYGNYEFCLTAYAVIQNEELGSGCSQVENNPTSPPILISPYNESEIDVHNPLLVWLPPTPVQKGISFDLKICELMLNQTPYDAIQRNLPYYFEKNINQTSLLYPSTSLKLTYGNTYAWQIVAKTNDGSFIGQTEVWTFKLSTARDSAMKEQNDQSGNYVVPGKQQTGGPILTGRELKIWIDDPNQQRIEAISIFNSRNQELENNQIEIISEGGGRYRIRLDEVKGIDDGKLYTLTMTLSNKEKRFIFFKYIVK